METLQAGFEYLSPPIEVNFVEHGPSYIKTGSRENVERRIFYGVPLDDFEQSKIREVEGILAKRGIPLPPGWNDRETLRYVYGSRFNVDGAIEKILECLQWRGSHNRNQIPDASLKLLESGAIYTYGRDPSYRPVIIIDLGKLNLTTYNGENIEIALITLLDILKEYCFVPGKVENWIVIVDARGKEFNQLPLQDIGDIFSTLNSCYPLTLEKLLLLNSSPSFGYAWSQIEKLIHPGTKEKINLFDSSQLLLIQRFVPSNQLESKFGGSLPDLTKFWIPRVPLNPLSPKKPQNLQNDHLARLSQQIESVEGRFNKLAQDRKSQGPPPGYQMERSYQTASFGLGSTTSNYTEDPKRYTTGYFPNTQAYNLEKSREFSGFESSSNNERVKRSALPQSDGVEVIRQQRIVQSSQPIVEYRVEERLPQRRREREEESDEEEEDKAGNFDFNDRELLDLIMNENSLLKSQPKERYLVDNVGSRDVPRVDDYLKNIDRSSASNVTKTFGDYTNQGSTQGGTTVVTRNEEVVKKSSSPYGSNDYFNNSSNAKYVTTKTEYEVVKSSAPGDRYENSYMKSSNYENDKSVEDWQYAKHKQQRPIPHEEEEDEDESNFCGICVSRRRRPGQATNV